MGSLPMTSQRLMCNVMCCLFVATSYVAYTKRKTMGNAITILFLLLNLLVSSTSAWTICSPSFRHHDGTGCCANKSNNLMYLTTTTTHQHFRSTSTTARGGGGRQRLFASNHDKDDDGIFDPFLSGSDFGSIDNIDNEDLKSLTGLIQNKVSVGAPILALAALQQLPLEANAADGSNGGGQLLSALAAYGHYFSLFVIVGCLVTERLTVRPNMSDEEENRLAIADTTYGVAGLLLAYTGYLRATADWGKGFDYYAHEPIFWVKIIFVAIFGAVSFFPTTKIIQRSIDKRYVCIYVLPRQIRVPIGANDETMIINGLISLVFVFMLYL